jgi:hypothetical protein
MVGSSEKVYHYPDSIMCESDRLGQLKINHDIYNRRPNHYKEASRWTDPKTKKSDALTLMNHSYEPVLTVTWTCVGLQLLVAGIASDIAVLALGLLILSAPQLCIAGPGFVLSFCRPVQRPHKGKGQPCVHGRTNPVVSELCDWHDAV